MKFKKKSSPQKPLGQLLNFIPPFFYFELGGHFGWKSGSPDTILEGDHPRKIEISSNDQNCSIVSQNVPKFELYKHDELFNIYYRIFYEL
jgi:hypothetical protein